LSESKRLRFRIRRGDFEVELEGDYDYVKGRFEELMEEATHSGPNKMETIQTDGLSSIGLRGIIESKDGNVFFTIPVDTITAKEAVALSLYAKRPNELTDEELSSILSSGWKTMKPEAVRARASELRREGKLIAERGRYRLSGAGLQWMEGEVLLRLQRLPQNTT